MFKVISVPTIEQVIADIRKMKVVFPNREKTLRKEMKYYRCKDATYTESDIVNNDNVVTFSVKNGSTKKYNQDNIVLSVGLNLYNQDIEELLIGMRKGETKEININNQNLEITVKEIKVKNYKEITLDAIKLDQPNITSIKEYEDSVYKNVCDRIIYPKFQKLIYPKLKEKLYAISITDGRLQAKDLDPVFLDFCKIRFNYMSSEEKKAEQIKCLSSQQYNFIPTEEGKSKEEYLKGCTNEQLDNYFNEGIAQDNEKSVIETFFCKINGVDLSEERYTNECKKIADRNNGSIEEAKTKFTYDIFLGYFVSSSLQELFINKLIEKNIINIIEE